MEASAMVRSLLSAPPPHPFPHRRSAVELPSSCYPALRAGIPPPIPSLSLSDTRSRSSFAARCSVDDAVKAENSVPIEKRFPAFPTVIDINQIRDILPHRFPFLLVDRVIEYNPGVTAVGIKNVTINDNFFPGHFPDRPIMPGVLMVEAMAQVGGLVMLQPEKRFGIAKMEGKAYVGGEVVCEGEFLMATGTRSE